MTTLHCKVTHYLVHTTPEKFDNAALFLRLGLPSTLIRHENGAFRKRLSNRKNLTTPALRFSADGKSFQNGAFSKKMTSRYSRDCPDRVFLKHKSKMTGDCSVFKFLRRNVDGVLYPSRYRGYSFAIDTFLVDVAITEIFHCFH